MRYAKITFNGTGFKVQSNTKCMTIFTLCPPFSTLTINSCTISLSLIKQVIARTSNVMFIDKVQLQARKPLDTFAVSLLITFHILTRNYFAEVCLCNLCVYSGVHIWHLRPMKITPTEFFFFFFAVKII